MYLPFQILNQTLLSGKSLFILFQWQNFNKLLLILSHNPSVVFFDP